MGRSGRAQNPTEPSRKVGSLGEGQGVRRPLPWIPCRSAGASGGIPLSQMAHGRAKKPNGTPPVPKVRVSLERDRLFRSIVTTRFSSS